MTSTVKNWLIAALTALSTLLASILLYVNATPVIPDGGTGAGGAVASGGRGGKGGVGPSPAGSVAPPDAGRPVPPSANGFSVAINPWFVDPSWTGEKWFSSQGVLSQTFVDQIKPFSTFRHMDSNAINCSKQSSWSTRRLPSDPKQIAYGAADGNGDPGVAIEYQVDVCNAAMTDCWFNVPHLATDDYVQQMASLIKGRIRSGLQVYVELSNEFFNGQFCQCAYSQQQGAALGLPGSNVYYQGEAWGVYRSLQVAKIFKSVIPSARHVVAFSGNYDLMSQALQSVYKSSKWNPSNVSIDMLAVAPYIGRSPYSSASFRASVDSYASTGTDRASHARAIADLAGIKVLGCYETGGNYTGSDAATYAASASTGPDYTYMLDKWSKIFNGPCALYAHASEWKSGTSWGLYKNDGTASPRVSAVQTWIATH